MALGHMRNPQTVLRYVPETAHLPRVAALRVAARWRRPGRRAMRVRVRTRNPSGRTLRGLGTRAVMAAVAPARSLHVPVCGPFPCSLWSHRSHQGWWSRVRLWPLVLWNQT